VFVTIEQKVAKLLISQKKTLAVAESCTGGLLSNRLTDIPGSSNFFQLGLVVYSDKAKTKFLRIPARIFVLQGAVSNQAARQMAEGIRRILETDFGIGITGIAGPTGGSPQKPVGLVFIAIAAHDEILCEKCLFKGSRKRIKSQATTKALQLLLKSLM